MIKKDKKILTFLALFLFNIFTFSFSFGEYQIDKSIEEFRVNSDISNFEVNNRKIGIALGGGSAKGIAHIGILKVLEKEKVPIEYITGTSMGSIIASLYAVGYTIEEIEEIAKNMDWVNLFNDSKPRETKGIITNIIEDSNVTTLPIEAFLPKLPSGIIGGQNAITELNELFYPILNERNFKKFPIKLAVVATDLNTGEGVMIDSGSVSVAVRASLSLPSIYNPIPVGDRLYVDGGVIRNLPVQDLKVLGADYTIGVNVGEGFKEKEINKLNVIEVISDSMTIASRQEVERQIRMLDMYIYPNLEGIDSFSFNKVDEIIRLGEKAAQNNIEDIRKLSDPEKFEMLQKKRREYRNSWEENYNIVGIKVVGNKDYTKQYFIKDFDKNKINYTKKELKNIIDNLYRKGNFSSVYYEIMDSEKIDADELFTLNDRNIENTKILVINVQEKVGSYVKMTQTLNNEEYIKAKIGFQGQNYLFDKLDTKYDFNLIIAEEYGVNGTFFSSLGNENKVFAIGNFYYGRDFIKNQYYNNSKYNIENHIGRASLGLGITNDKSGLLYISGGFERSKILKNLSNSSDIIQKYPFLEFKYIYDSRNNSSFFTRGLNFETTYIIADSDDTNFDSLRIKGEFAIPINNKLTLKPRFEYLTSDGDNIPEHYKPKIGGYFSKGYSMEFSGIDTDSMRGNSIFSIGASLQYQIMNRVFAQVSYDTAKISEKTYSLNGEKIETYNFGLGVRLPIGPIYLGLSKSPSKSWKYFFNIGYNFRSITY